MIGCCGAESSKFKDKDGNIDQERLNEIAAKKESQGWAPESALRLQKCSCPCHQDGMHVMC
ncbi:hypothetical protein [Pseudomonas sp. CFBP 13719]|uniref:hypothetical protein n=1 Tax=Pseudomonas sp. CFBP 13719 TaxID=2775303 RepID=UPI001783C316|nr:hypothetical protein [Pseudomonas sp. CFBP 13719]MBD8614937.1 hypothetical protein [Pseudomonas putida]MBD8681378.1 hypothetical protein [Pseudomonas sp. CFBP 13719]